MGVQSIDLISMKNTDKHITIEEAKSIQLDMLKEIDKFCRENSIRYSLAFGTLLGAIRHKGFIPWDDDVDIMMPLPDMLRFRELFHSHTLRYCDVDFTPGYGYGFSRISNTLTYNKRGLVVKDYGICIDLYPIVSIPKETREQSLFFEKANTLNQRRFFMMKWNERAIKCLPIKSIPGYRKVIRAYRDYMLDINNYGKTGVYYIIAGPLELRDKMTYPFDLFKKLIEVDFEGYRFCAIDCYDYYLSLRYGDYMQLPPEDQRHPYHGGDYYWV